ncbi:MAG: translation initiation factor IF-1 [Christensenellaceae bacterium]|jgi:translation initiation factor IF-1|nr:translation initiation factor IF-1 [Christensenellaceae bacterium]
MSKGDHIELEGIVIEVMRNATFKVKIANGHILTARVSGKLYKNNIRILENDSVKVNISPYDLTNGIITWRGKQTL